MTAREFLHKALAHYSDKLAEEHDRYGIIAISDCFIESGSCTVVEKAEALWKDISTQTGNHLQVGYVSNDPQEVFAILSKEPLAEPKQTHLLWAIVQFLKREEDESEKIEALDFYEGPYRLEIPESVFDN